MNIEKNTINPVRLEDEQESVPHEENNQIVNNKPANRWKGIFYGVLSGLCFTANQAMGKWLFVKYPDDLYPEQLMLFRASIAFIFTLIAVNKNLFKVMYSEVPSGHKTILFFRILLVAINGNIAQSVIKYLSLTFTAIIKNMSPFAVIFLSGYFLKTKIEQRDVLFCLICLSAVTLVIIGYGENDNNKSSATSQLQLTIAIIAAFCSPLADAGVTILTRKLKAIPDRTIQCYMNPATIIIMSTVIMVKGTVENTQQLLTQKFSWGDICILIISGLLISIAQTLFVIAIKNEEPAKIAQLNYLTSIYQLLIDLFIFNQILKPIQWAGLVILVIAFYIRAKLYSQEKNNEKK